MAPVAVALAGIPVTTAMLLEPYANFLIPKGDKSVNVAGSDQLWGVGLLLYVTVMVGVGRFVTVIVSHLVTVYVGPEVAVVAAACSAGTNVVRTSVAVASIEAILVDVTTSWSGNFGCSGAAVIKRE